MCCENKTWRKALALIIFLCIGTILPAGDVLERTVSVRFEQVPLTDALAEIARQGGFEWSYNAHILDRERRVSLVANGWTVREVLLFVLGDAYTFKQNGEYLILKKRKKPQQHLSGYISDKHTGRRMANVTVYDRQTLKSTTTDQNGYYELPVTAQSEIVISKLSYRDTVLHVDAQTPRLVKLDLYTDTVPHSEKPSFREEMNRFAVKMENFFVGSSQTVANLNVRDSLHRYFQIGFLPGLGTNHRLSGSVINDWSLNLLAGYSRGNRVFEIGGLGNINREDVGGFQSGGLFNITGGGLNGVQFAGLFNNLGGRANGAQFAGVYNFAGDAVRGVQFAGIANIARDVSFQSAGVFNLSANGKVNVQFAGVSNHAHLVRGVQAAGVLNSADSLHGCQFSGLVNRAGHVKGAQIGLFNFAREVDGVQIGLINYSRYGGYVVLEAASNDVFPVNTAFKSGTEGLYTILSAGFDPAEPSVDPAGEHFWGYGLGLGTRARLTRNIGITFDLLHRHLNKGSHDNEVQEWEQLAASLDLNIGKHFSIAGGPSANLLIANPDVVGSQEIREKIVSKNWLGASSDANGWLSAWLGWTASVRVRF